MDYSNIYAEQVGFVEKSLKGDFIRLQMMGGEFCGNATRSLAALAVDKKYPYVKRKDNKYIVPIDVSGSEEIINCQVMKTNKENVYKSKINMPLPINIKEYKIDTYKLVRVDFPGISHFIVNDNEIKDREALYKLVKKEMDNKVYDAFGIMYYDYEKKFMTPLVYVKGTDSLIWERSCASGTTAFGIALSYKDECNINKNIQQPGGDLEVSVEFIDNKIGNVSLNGSVEIVAEGIVYI